MAALRARTRMPRTRSSLLAISLREWRVDADVVTGDDVQSCVRTEHDQEHVELGSASESAEQPLKHQSSSWQISPAGDAHLAEGLVAARAITSMPAAPIEGAVWVDCFFYGFWIEKNKVAEYRRSS